MRFTPLTSLLKSGGLLKSGALPKASQLPDPASLMRRLMPGFDIPSHNRQRAPIEPAPDAAAPGAFLTRDFDGPAGSRPYKIYVPTGYHGQKLPLIVMLHGCKQSPDDFAAGTRMNIAGEHAGCLVAYPGQTAQANMQRCWNWFNEADQRRDTGETAVIAGITRDIMQTYAVDPARVFVAGLSAGGAQAAIMAAVFPELYAAAGIHSGLAFGAANDLPSALMAMRIGGRGGQTAAGPIVPVIVFHGDGDTTVHPANGDEIIARIAPGLRTSVERGRVTGGHAYTRTSSFDATGKVVAEQWLVQGGSHGWFGGSTAGSFTDPTGPDATREMVRFFLEHAKE